MGLMLSILIVCVGVIEALSCYEHFQYGVVHCATNIYEKARRRSSLFLNYTSRRLKLLSEDSVTEEEDEQRPKPYRSSDDFEELIPSECKAEISERNRETKNAKRHSRKLDSQDKVDIVKKLLEKPKRPRTVRSISMPELTYTEKDLELTQLINELVIEPIEEIDFEIEIDETDSDILVSEFDRIFEGSVTDSGGTPNSVFDSCSNHLEKSAVEPGENSTNLEEVKSDKNVFSSKSNENIENSSEKNKESENFSSKNKQIDYTLFNKGMKRSILNKDIMNSYISKRNKNEEDFNGARTYHKSAIKISNSLKRTAGNPRLEKSSSIDFDRITPFMTKSTSVDFGVLTTSPLTSKNDDLSFENMKSDGENVSTWREPCDLIILDVEPSPNAIIFTDGSINEILENEPFTEDSIEMIDVTFEKIYGDLCEELPDIRNVKYEKPEEKVMQGLEEMEMNSSGKYINNEINKCILNNKGEFSKQEAEKNIIRMEGLRDEKTFEMYSKVFEKLADQIVNACLRELKFAQFETLKIKHVSNEKKNQSCFEQKVPNTSGFTQNKELFQEDERHKSQIRDFNNFLSSDLPPGGESIPGIIENKTIQGSLTKERMNDTYSGTLELKPNELKKNGKVKLEPELEHKVALDIQKEKASEVVELEKKELIEDSSPIESHDVVLKNSDDHAQLKARMSVLTVDAEKTNIQFESFESGKNQNSKMLAITCENLLALEYKDGIERTIEEVDAKPEKVIPMEWKIEEGITNRETGGIQSMSNEKAPSTCQPEKMKALEVDAGSQLKEERCVEVVKTMSDFKFDEILISGIKEENLKDIEKTNSKVKLELISKIKDDDGREPSQDVIQSNEIPKSKEFIEPSFGQNTSSELPLKLSEEKNESLAPMSDKSEESSLLENSPDKSLHSKLEIEKTRCTDLEEDSVTNLQEKVIKSSESMLENQTEGTKVLNSATETKKFKENAQVLPFEFEPKGRPLDLEMIESVENANSETKLENNSVTTKGNVENVSEHSNESKNQDLKEGKQTKSSPEAFWIIFSGEYTKAMSKDWHSGHFSCWQCDEALTGQRYVLRDDHPYCIKCYESVFANVCEECNKIIGIDSKDLSYKDKHWHEACFLCNKCRVSLVDKQFGSKADKIYCGNCYDAQFASRCDGCGEIFRAGTKKMEYKTRQWHEKCFCCCVCKTPIGTKSFIPREQEIYCATCYEEKFATRCVKCNKIITSGGVTYKNEPWHRECFTCTNCNTSLAGQRFTSRDEKPYCADCFGELFAKRCTACSRPITGIGGTRFISFEDRHWHNDCFICAACKTSLVGRGFITDGDDIICPECAKQKLM